MRKIFIFLMVFFIFALSAIPPLASRALAENCVVLNVPLTISPNQTINVTLGSLTPNEFYYVAVNGSQAGSAQSAPPYNPYGSSSLDFSIPGSYFTAGRYTISGWHATIASSDQCIGPTTVTVGSGAGCNSFLDCVGNNVPGVSSDYTPQGLPGQIISKFLPSILGILGFLTVIMIVVSGIQFISSSGNPEAAAGARGRLTYAIIGFILVILAFAILQIVNKLFLNTPVV